MDLGLDGKIALVGGASDGIGYGIAELLAQEGARVGVFARREPRLSEAVERLRRETGGEVIAIQGDCGEADDVARAVRTVVEHFGGIDIVVTNDGGPPIARIETFDDAKWQKAFDRHFFYVLRTVREALPHMKKRGGSIVNVVSAAVVRPQADFGLSVAAWAAVVAYAKVLALEVGKYGINVNTLLSGSIDTPRLQLVSVENRGLTLEQVNKKTPLGRVGTPQEFARVAALLVSPAGQYVNGQAIKIDGGAHMRVP